MEEPTEAARRPKRRAIFAALEPRYRKRLAIVALLAFFLSTVTGPANTFVYLYAQNVKHLAGIVTAAMVACAGAAGLFGLILGRWSADRFGRRLTGSVSMMLVAILAVVTYGGSKIGLFLGYVAAVGVASVLAPAAGALSNELFPTEVRASIGGWLAAASVTRSRDRANRVRSGRRYRQPVRRGSRGDLPAGSPGPRSRSSCCQRPRATNPRTCGPS